MILQRRVHPLLSIEEDKRNATEYTNHRHQYHPLQHQQQHSIKTMKICFVIILLCTWQVTRLSYVAKKFASHFMGVKLLWRGFIRGSHFLFRSFLSDIRLKYF